MYYKSVINIDADKHDDFVKSSPLVNLLQSSKWAEIKDNWDSFRFSLVDEQEQIKASALVLVKKVLGFSIYYIPRGPIFDYKDKAVREAFFSELKKHAKKEKVIFIKFDPAIIENKKVVEEFVSEDNQQNKELINELSQIKGMKYLGKTTFIKESFQPRFIMGIEDEQNYQEHLPRRTKKAMRAAQKHNVEVSVYGREYLDEFARLMKLTEERKNVSLRNIDYYKKLLSVYPSEGYLYLASVNLPKLITQVQQQVTAIEEQLATATSKKTINRLQEELKPLVKQLSNAQDLGQKYPGEREFIAGGIMVGFGDQMELLYAGMNQDFASFNPQYLVYTSQFDDSFNNGYRFCSMGGVEGTLEDGLSLYKKAYNPQVIEYIGEFDYVLNPLMYSLYKIAYKLRG